MKMTRPLRRVIFFYLALHLTAVLIFLAVFVPWLHRQLVSQVRRQMELAVSAMSTSLQNSPPNLEPAEVVSRLQPLIETGGWQLTLLSPDLEILGGWPEAQPVADGPRPEVRAAARQKFGFDRRRSGPNRENELHLALSHPPNAPPGQVSFFLCLSVPEHTVIPSNAHMQWTVLLFGLLPAVLAILLMATYAAREMEPLRQFSEAARRIAAGQYDELPTVLERTDEWRDLSQAFRQMQAELAVRETRLAENSQRLEAVLSSMIEGVLALDAQGHVLLANQAACDMLGLAPGQLLKRKLLELVRVPELRLAIERTQSERTFGTIEFQTFDFPRKTISARVSVLIAEPLPGVTIVLQDVTELRQLELMRRDFVANVSHELKTPLSTIKAYAETLLLGALDDSQINRQFVEQIETQAQLLHEQILDLLQLAKIEAGQALPELTAVPLVEVCREVVTLHAAEADARNLTLNLVEPVSSLSAQADREAVRTIVDNLVTNAIRYTPAGGSVTVSLQQEQQEVVIAVADTGIGIAAEHQPRIFERFYRVDRARSRELGGTGLGLSIVKHLVQTLGGSVHLSSRPGKGSTFQIRLPAWRTD